MESLSDARIAEQRIIPTERLAISLHLLVYVSGGIN
jgi:hypothetical protein